jgi:hypothetical protein
VDHSNNDTAAVASIEDLAECTASVDARIETVLQGVMAQRRSVVVALDYVTVLGSGVKANCWSLAEAAGHDGQVSSPAFFGPGSYWSYATSWLFNQAS